MTKIIERCGFTGFEGQSFRTYRILDLFWFHINKKFCYPFISFKWIPF